MLGGVLVCLGVPHGVAAPGDTQIIGGAETTGFPAVVELELAGSYCSGVVVGKRAVLTAAHCIDDLIVSGEIASARALFGAHTSEDGGVPDRAVPVLRGWYHPYFGEDSYYFYDIAIVELAEDAEVEPVAIDWTGNAVAPGDTVVAVGYGYATASMESAGRKRFAELTVTELSRRYVGTEDPGRSICDGDSGGPLLAGPPDGPFEVVGVHSIATCIDRAHATRVSGYAAFVRAAFDAIEGPCTSDDVCVGQGCTTIDPDCDACGLDGTCGAGCAARDWDCPARDLGELCAGDDECASGLCTDGIEDPRIRYCALPCTERFAENTCQGRTTCEVLDEQQSACKYTAPSPTAQGALCDGPEDCRSGICDLRVRICAEPCGDGGTCPEKFTCADYQGTAVCTRAVADGGGSCATAPGATAPGDRHGGAALLGLGALLLAARRRRNAA